MEGTIKFKLSEFAIFVFRKRDFKSIVTSWTSGTTGTVVISFQAENSLMDHDKMTLTVKKEYIDKTADKICEFINSEGHDVVESGASGTGLFSSSILSNILWTAGI
jgi:hypothetical protein